MSQHGGPNAEADEDLEWDDRPAPEILAEMTGRPASEFEADDYAYPSFDELEVVDE